MDINGNTINTPRNLRDMAGPPMLAPEEDSITIRDQIEWRMRTEALVMYLEHHDHNVDPDVAVRGAQTFYDFINRGVIPPH